MSIAVERLECRDRIVEDGELLVRVGSQVGSCLVQLYGELDVAAVETLERELRRVESTVGLETMVADLSGLDFIDTTGLCVLLGARRRAERGGWRLGLLRPSGDAARTITLTGLDEALPFLD